MGENHQQIKWIIFIILFFLIVLNILVLDLAVFKVTQKPVLQQYTYLLPTVMPTQISSPAIIIPTTIPECPQPCISIIKQAAASANKVSSKTNIISTGVKDFYVPIGAGSTSASDWEDIGGLQVLIDYSQYGKIKSAVFEANVRVPTKDQWVDVRLFNITDQHPVWFSEIRLVGGAEASLITSSPIVTDTGAKLYKVQMKTQLTHPAYLDQSKIHITVY